MALTLSKDWDEVCYPFIVETSYLCDFEAITDELCTLIGMAYSATPESMTDVRTDLDRLQPLAFHINGSIRGRLAVCEDDALWLKSRLNHYQEEVKEQLIGFVLPRGLPPVPQLHLARSSAKKAIRALVRVDQEGIAVPDILPRMLNMICNLCFILTLVVNKRSGINEAYFESKSYGKLK